jgi:hypothetical protein
LRARSEQLFADQAEFNTTQDSLRYDDRMPSAPLLGVIEPVTSIAVVDA